MMAQVDAIAKLKTTVLLQGETGCGKEVIAN
ncbi:MAG: sigma 54-interacting transcriptional regulator, partial [Emcibacter sp.]|nr:sigma 54-interacting transcriptional regulator [Emcibacter sp.]